MQAPGQDEMRGIADFAAPIALDLTPALRTASR
jgi:hypothetical protein